MRTLTRSYDRKIAGVAGGLAAYFDMDVTLMRALWVLGAFVMPPTILAYIVLAIMLPAAGAPASDFDAPYAQPQDSFASPRRYRRMTKSYDRWLFGVAGGIAEYFEIDPVLIRALFVGAAFLGGTGVLAYIILALLMPRSQYQYR